MLCYQRIDLYVVFNFDIFQPQRQRVNLYVDCHMCWNIQYFYKQ